jgi:hypothetical protein
MSDDISDGISDYLEWGWLDPVKRNEVPCWYNKKTYRAIITFEEVS